MKKYIFFITFVSAVTLSAQRMHPILEINPIIVKSDSTYICFLSYQIPYKNLVFVKKNSGYDGGIQLQFEIYNNDKIVKRESASSETEIFDYEESNSSEHYLFGYCKFDIDSGEYIIKPSFQIKNTQREGLLKDIQVSVAGDSNGIPYQPIVLEETNEKCVDYFIVNHKNDIPYSLSSYDLLVRSKLPIKKINLYQNEKLIESRIVDKNIYFEFAVCEDRLGVKEGANQKGYSYILKNVNQKLNVDKYQLRVFSEKDSVEYDGDIEWFDAPISLTDPEFAIEILETVFPKSEVETLLDYPDEEYSKALMQFWEKYDKNKETGFNELMYEFYNRVDYAIKKFKSVNKRNGAESAMGKVFIKFGEPDNIERTYTENYKTVEVWKYTGLKKEFVFVDKNGLGNFELVN